MTEEEPKEFLIIQCHQELIDLLKEMEANIKDATWYSIDKVGWKNLTQMFARKIKSDKQILRILNINLKLFNPLKS